MRPGRWIWLPVLLVFALLGACSGDDYDEATEPDDETTTTTIASLDADDIDAEASPYCATWAEIRATGGPAITGDPEGDNEVRRQYYSELLPLVERLREQAPEEIAAAVDVALEMTRSVGANGDPAPFEDPAVMAAQQELAGYAQESCARSQ